MKWNAITHFKNWLFIATHIACLLFLPGCQDQDLSPVSHQQAIQQTFFASDILSKPFADKLDIVSAELLGYPYSGKGSIQDAYGFHHFDCVTYVEHVLALSLATSADQYQQIMRRIRYKDGMVGFVEQNHFTDIDWLPNNAWLLKDQTPQIFMQIFPKKSLSYEHYIVNKAAWFKKMAPKEIKHNKALMQHHLKTMKPVPVRLPYISKQDILNHLEIFEQKINEPMILHWVIQPDYFKKKLGTSYGISHQALILKHNGRLVVRHATKTKGAVVEQSLQNFVEDQMNSPNLLGLQWISIFPPYTKLILK